MLMTNFVYFESIDLYNRGAFATMVKKHGHMDVT